MKRKTIEARLRKAPAPAADTQRIREPHSASYSGAELRPFTGRPGAMDAFVFPSRMGSRLHYRDGTVVKAPA